MAFCTVLHRYRQALFGNVCDELSVDYCFLQIHIVHVRINK